MIDISICCIDYLFSFCLQRHFRLAAECDHDLAQFNLGLRLVSGDGVGKDLCEAMRWLGKAAVKGHSGSQYMLAVCVLNGDGGLEQDIPEAVRLLKLAANQEHVDAMFELGNVYRGDHNRTKAKAVLRLRELVKEHGDVTSKCDGYMDLEESEKWYQLGASLGHGGCLYESGVLSRKAGKVKEA